MSKLQYTLIPILIAIFIAFIPGGRLYFKF